MSTFNSTVSTKIPKNTCHPGSNPIFDAKHPLQPVWRCEACGGVIETIPPENIATQRVKS